MPDHYITFLAFLMIFITLWNLNIKFIIGNFNRVSSIFNCALKK